MTARRIVAAIVATVILCCTGCASLWSDVKSEAKACGPTAEQDVLVALPYIGALAVCEAKHGDCTGILADLKALGIGDLASVEQCATVKLHDATVKMAANADAGTGQ